MAKFKFGAPPKTFKRNIKFETLEGVKEDFDVVFNYRSRKEAGALFDEMLSAAKARGAGKDKDDLTMTEIMEATTGDNSKYLLKALHSWELEQDLNEASAERLANEWPGAANAIMEAYRTACLEGRSGN
ncbi:MAG TPA: phage tail assembly chaperone [Burkholderiaceae bacterium]|nr:phage tail assembly chaperone [Burkholderiaceae bacterium]HNM39998.1 phage tail assembly chaperone [Giesbergeria sp.]